MQYSNLLPPAPAISFTSRFSFCTATDKTYYQVSLTFCCFCVCEMKAQKHVRAGDFSKFWKYIMWIFVNLMKLLKMLGLEVGEEYWVLATLKDPALSKLGKQIKNFVFKVPSWSKQSSCLSLALMGWCIPLHLLHFTLGKCVHTSMSARLLSWVKTTTKNLHSKLDTDVTSVGHSQTKSCTETIKNFYETSVPN